MTGTSPPETGRRAMRGASQMERNPGMSLDTAMFEGCAIDPSAVERRAEDLGKPRPVDEAQQAVRLLDAIRCIDLTTLAGDDTAERVRRLCEKARNPLAAPVCEALGLEALTTASVCVYPTMVPHAVAALDGSGVPVASVAAGFPAGLTPLHLRLEEIRWAVAAGAAEIDVVITREHVLTANWQALHDEIAAMRAACGAAHMKVILSTGELQTLHNVYAASMVAIQAGADFIKTSTGKESVNATLPVGLVMIRALRKFNDVTGHRIGFKAAGGIRRADEALTWQFLMMEALDHRWLVPGFFRFGASALLGDIERWLHNHIAARGATAGRRT